MEKYFKAIEEEVRRAYAIAQRARKKGYDPEPRVDIPLAKDVAGRVEGLVGAVQPKIVGKGVPERIRELEKEYHPGDWRIALIIAEEIAKEKFCEFDSQEQALETGIRAGFAYLTLGVVSAPLEGFVELRIKSRGGKRYLANYYAGPVRAAGGTAAAVSVLLTDYLRIKFGFDAFKPTKQELERYYIELMDYHHRVSRLQYLPTKEEVFFLLEHIPIEITGDPTTDFEVSNLKDVAETPRVRGGMCLVIAEALAQKAKKLLKNLKKWGKDFELNWDWLEEFLEIQKKAHGGKGKVETKGIEPNYRFIEEAVAGRPILSYPLRKGGFRIRYGRTRLSGLAAAAIHPATMRILGDFVATGTQLKVERPGKACAITPCDSIYGPVVRLKDGTVLRLNDEEEALRVRDKVEKILFLGDILFSYGDFYEQGHKLVPSPYVSEWWVQEVERNGGPKLDPFEKIDVLEACKISERYGVPFHPDYTLFWSHITPEQLQTLISALKGSHLSPKLVRVRNDPEVKEILEEILLPHRVEGGEIVVEGEWAFSLLVQLGYVPKKEFGEVDLNKKTLENVNNLCVFEVREVAQTYLGARLGRPEKAKLRKLKGRPQVLFPCGQQGGRMRDLIAAYDLGYVEAEFPIFYCGKCNRTTIFPTCEVCGEPTEPFRICPKCGKLTKLERHCVPTKPYQRRRIDIKHYLNTALRNLGVEMPSMLKGVRGVSNKTRIGERLEKGILRAIHGLYVNKDGTMRYDMIEVPVTHFTPKEIGTPVEKLRELGYEKDMYGRELVRDDQVVELFPQDLILPDCEYKEASIVDFLIKAANFIDDLLVRFYGLEPFYNVKSKEDLIGMLVIGIAPHTSAGVVGRIIGFSKTQGFYAHPYFHAAMRRNCDGDESAIILLMDAFLNFSRQYLPDKRGSRTMDAPLVLTVNLDPMGVDSEVYNMDVVPYYPLALYEKSQEFAYPWDISIERIEDRLGKPEQFFGMRYTHPVKDMNSGTLVSSYKTLLLMLDKLEKQMELAVKIKAVDSEDVARLVIEKHFLQDLKGNLRKFSKQSFRCIDCNELYRRIPLGGKCLKCGGKLVLTVAEGTVNKYLKPSLELAEKFNITGYMRQVLEIVKRRVESLFGKEKEVQEGLERFINSRGASG
ncbi:MAG: DNA polymerase II large subunit [Nanoarchaeota archaeon]|nr:DNA polymerase II large subunit [Nanoarchaeota archaeon]